MRLSGKLTAKRVAKILARGEPGNWHDGNRPGSKSVPLILARGCRVTSLTGASIGWA